MGSAQERSLVQQHLQAGLPLPDEIVNAPRLFEGLEIYFQAFFDLDTERHHGNGLMPIPWSAILRYARYNEFDERQTSDLMFYIARMDSWNLNHLAEKQKADAKK